MQCKRKRGKVWIIFDQSHFLVRRLDPVVCSLPFYHPYLHLRHCDVVKFDTQCRPSSWYWRQFHANLHTKHSRLRKFFALNDTFHPNASQIIEMPLSQHKTWRKALHVGLDNNKRELEMRRQSWHDDEVIHIIECKSLSRLFQLKW